MREAQGLRPSARSNVYPLDRRLEELTCCFGGLGVLTAVVGLLGVLLGAGVARGYTFWSMRRAELAEALCVAETIASDLRRLHFAWSARNSAVIHERQARIQDVWGARGHSLLLHMGPGPFRGLAEDMRQTGNGEELADLVQKLEQIAQILWDEHEAVIVVPLIRIIKHWFGRAATLSQKLAAVVVTSES